MKPDQGERAAGRAARGRRGLAVVGFATGTWFVGFAIVVLALQSTPALVVAGWGALAAGVLCAASGATWLLRNTRPARNSACTEDPGAEVPESRS